MVRKGLIGILVLAGLFIVLNRMLGLSQRRIEMAMSYLAYPLLRAQNSFRNASIFSSQEGVQNLLTDLERVTRERDRLLIEHISLKALERAVADTKDLRDFMRRYETNFLAIVPILLKNFSGDNFFLVDGGLNYGIEKGMVALYENSIVGKVVQVYPSYSKILLLTDPHCYVAAVCSSTGTKGMHCGLKKGFTTLMYADDNEQILVGDTVLSTGEGGLFPRGFGLGTITHVDQSGYGRAIEIAPLVDLKMISYCCLVSHGIRLQQSADQPEIQKPAES